jgi:HEAT repeat protein
MKTNVINGAAGVGAGIAVMSTAGAEKDALEAFLANIKSQDDKIRTAAWQTAGDIGAPAIKPLAKLMTDGDAEVARAAKHALWSTVRHVGRPGADQDRQAVAAELVTLLQDQPMSVRHEAIWMLSEIGDSKAVRPLAALLAYADTREDARAALERIPGVESISALQVALGVVPEEFKPAIANSLRVRGVKVEGYPSQKLVPTRPATAVWEQNVPKAEVTLKG